MPVWPGTAPRRRWTPWAPAGSRTRGRHAVGRGGPAGRRRRRARARALAGARRRAQRRARRGERRARLRRAGRSLCRRAGRARARQPRRAGGPDSRPRVRIRDGRLSETWSRAARSCSSSTTAVGCACRSRSDRRPRPSGRWRAAAGCGSPGRAGGSGREPPPKVPAARRSPSTGPVAGLKGVTKAFGDRWCASASTSTCRPARSPSSAAGPEPGRARCSGCSSGWSGRTRAGRARRTRPDRGSTGRGWRGCAGSTPRSSGSRCTSRRPRTP